MNINLITLPMNKSVPFDEEIDFTSLEFQNLNVKKINKCNVHAIVSQYETLLRVEVTVKAELTCISAYSLKDVPYKVNVSDEIDFGEEVQENDELIKNNILCLDDYVLTLILGSVPKRVTLKDEKLPENGNGYRVLTEKELEEERKNKHTSAFDCLDSLDLD